MKKRTALFLSTVLTITLLAGCFGAPSASSESTVSPLQSESLSATGANTIHIQFRGAKYPSTIGIRKFIGKDSFRTYPDDAAPFVGNVLSSPYVQEIVEVNSISTNQQHWCLVMDSLGVSGYVKTTDLAPITSNDDAYRKDGYGKGYETLGGFKIGDRIEKLIGTLDEDYYLEYENGPMYEFPDSTAIDARPDAINQQDVLFVLPDATNHVVFLRSSSSEFGLKDGYKPGDNFNKAVNFYKKKYPLLSEDKKKNLVYPDATVVFVMPDNSYLAFFSNTSTLVNENVTASTKIGRIEINPSDVCMNAG